MKDKKTGPTGPRNKNNKLHAKSTTAGEERKLLFKSSVVPVSSKYAIRLFMREGNSGGCEWTPHVPPKALLQKFIETGAYFEARNQIMGELAEYIGGNVVAIDLTAPGGEA